MPERIIVGDKHTVDRYGNGMPKSRLIGIEVRFRDMNGVTEELFIVPCDVVLPPGTGFGPGTMCRLSLTAHLSYGDRNGEIQL